SAQETGGGAAAGSKWWMATSPSTRTWPATPAPHERTASSRRLDLDRRPLLAPCLDLHRRPAQARPQARRGVLRLGSAGGLSLGGPPRVPLLGRAAPPPPPCCV